MKKIYAMALCGCMATGVVFADAINSQLNPKAVHKAVSSFATVVASGAQSNGMLGYEKIKECLLKYVSKDGKYDTNITVKQFGLCCMEGLRNPESCKKMIEDVVFEHNLLAGSMRPVPTLCTWQDLNSIPFAKAGHYVYVNGVKRCAATECVPGAYLARSVQQKRYGQSDGYCIKGEDPWILQNGKYVLKTEVVKQTQPESEEKTQQKQSGQEETVSDKKQKTEFLPDALMEMDFYKQYCVGTGSLKCFRSETGVTNTLDCTIKSGVNHDEMLRDALAVCNGTFVAKSVVNENVDNTNVVKDNNETIAILHPDENILTVAGVDASSVQIKANIPEQSQSREELLAAAKKNAERNAMELASDATKGSEKTKAKIDALQRQQNITQAYIGDEDKYNLDDLDASIAYAEKVKGQQKELQKLKKQEEKLEKKLEKQVEIENKKQARQEKQDVQKAKKSLEQEKSRLKKEIDDMQKQIKDLTESSKSAKEKNAKKLEQKKKELLDLNNKIDEARRLSDKMHESGDSKLADKLKELKKLTDKRPALEQEIAGLERQFDDNSVKSQVEELRNKIMTHQTRIIVIERELAQK